MSKKKKIKEDAELAVEFQGLSNDDKKAIKAYNAVVHKGLAVLKGDPIKPVSKVPSTEVEALMEEFLKEALEEKRANFKLGFKELLEEKVKLDRFVKEQQTQFNKAVVAQKKEFTKKSTLVFNVLGGIEELKEDYLNTLAPEQTEE
ncbi:MAG: hypothetical protein KUG81_04570 [Gammaproteobacteria bacterium]|nr:hypothetical protein [Gammaproteobacteria bacterium]